jgi:hypothetical protein
MGLTTRPLATSSASVRYRQNIGKPYVWQQANEEATCHTYSAVRVNEKTQ